MRMRVSFEHDSKLFPGLFSLRDLTPRTSQISTQLVPSSRLVQKRRSFKFL